MKFLIEFIKEHTKEYKHFHDNDGYEYNSVL